MILTRPHTRWPRPWFGNGPALRPWSSTWLEREPNVFPALNVWADDDALYVEAEIPGLPLDALELSVMGDELTISGDRHEVIEDGVTHHRRERGTGPFSRVVRLPVPVDAEKVEAKLEHGVLLVTLPKAEAVRPRKIEVKAVR